MNESTNAAAEAESNERRFIEGRDYYFESGLLVMTADYLRRRGYCCKNGCRNCPYDDNGELE